jgi:predicted GNAT family N-acyltransferase
MITVRIAHGSDERAGCLTLRRTVFIDEQGVPEADEIDDLDDVSTHFLATDAAGRVVGTARLRFIGDDAKVQRVAVSRGIRGQGIGRALMRAVEREAIARGASRVLLSAQISAVPFYERLSYEAVGAVFDDAGIPHRNMQKPLSVPDGKGDAEDTNHAVSFRQRT